MKFEEVLPALKEGKKIRRASSKLGITFTKDEFFRLDSTDLLQADDWEIIKEKKKVKLRDLTTEQFNKWVGNYCGYTPDYCCGGCPFNFVDCISLNDTCRLKHKDLFSDKFLDQEVEIEE